MKLLAEERAILYTTYPKIAAAGPELTNLFYNHLFELDPSLRDLFKITMHEQGVKWRMMLNVLLMAIDEPAALEQSIRQMGQRHVGYGVKKEDYPKFVESVLWAIQKHLGAEYTPQVDAAWRSLFSLIVDLTTR